MTDITDEDRCVARAWAEGMTNLRLEDPDGYAAARVILATVDDTATTLAEELRDVADNSGMSSRAADRLHDIADRVEHALAEARAEVERLTAERLDRNSETDVRDKAALNNLDKAETVTVQKDAETTAETPDPADVQPGEAWLVECHGERRNAVKDNDDTVPWCTVNADCWFNAEKNATVTLLHRLVPAPRVITNRDDLDQAKRLTVILDSMGVVCERAPLGDGWFTTEHGTDQTPYIKLPATVLWEPGA